MLVLTSLHWTLHSADSDTGLLPSHWSQSLFSFIPKCEWLTVEVWALSALWEKGGGEGLFYQFLSL